MAKAWGVHRFWRRSVPASPAEEPDVLGEATQFLEGQLLESYRDNRESAPDWVWVSVLAHASEELLATCAAEGGPRRVRRIGVSGTAPFPSCPRCCSTTPNAPGCRSRSYSSDIVVPIELRLGARPLAPPTLVRLVLTGLQEREGTVPDHPAPTTERRT